MRTPSANDMFLMEYGGGKNFMTPTVLERGKISLYRAYEISRGKGIYDQTIWGVTIVDYNPDTKETTRRTDLGDCFQTARAASARVTSLKTEECDE